MADRVPEIDAYITDQAIIGGEADIQMMASLCKRHNVPLDMSVQLLFEAISDRLGYMLYRTIQNPLHFETIAQAAADTAIAKAHAARITDNNKRKPSS